MLEVSGIYKKFKKRQILNGASFTADPGQCIGIAGGNGCGKTTLLSILAGVLIPPVYNKQLRRITVGIQCPLIIR